MINWKLRLQNRETLTALVGVGLAFVYQVLGILGIVAPISQDMAVQLVALVINVLAAVGVVIDPTTKGIGDSQRALQYECPYCDEEAGE